MKTLEQEIISKMAVEIGLLKTSNIELDIRLMQALATVAALDNELEAIKNGNTGEEAE